MIAVECKDEVSFLFVLMQKKSLKFDKCDVHIKNKSETCCQARDGLVFITVRSHITEVSLSDPELSLSLRCRLAVLRLSSTAWVQTTHSSSDGCD